MKNVLRLIGPTLMIFMGLQVFGNVLITFLLFYGWLIAVPLFDGSLPKERWKITKRTMALGAGSGLLFFVFIFGGLNWLHTYFLDIEALRILLVEWGFSGPAEIGLVFVLLILNPVLEELYWRGYMYEKLRRNGTAVRTILMTASFYTLYHVISVLHLFEIGYSFAAVIPVFIAGLFWGAIREKTGSISAAIISHLLSDLGIICVYWFIIR